MNRQEPFIPIYDLSDSPPDEDSQPADEVTFQRILEDVLAAPIIKQVDADALDQLDADYDGICICYSDGSYVAIFHPENNFFNLLMGDI